MLAFMHGIQSHLDRPVEYINKQIYLTGYCNFFPHEKTTPQNNFYLYLSGRSWLKAGVMCLVNSLKMSLK